MKKVFLRYGAYSAIAEFIFFVLTWVVIAITGAGHKAQGYIGDVSVLCPLVFIYFGIRYYRDVVNNGTITFLSAIKLGLLIIILPAISFALVETVYVLYIDPTFYEKIMSYDLEQYRKILSPAKFALKMQEAQQQLATLKNPVFNFLGMIFTVVGYGILATLLSALLLMKKVKN